MSISLQGKTILITGASRGIGRAMALKFAKAGANIVVAAKSSEPHPKLPGTIHSVAAEIEQLGAKALALQVDVRNDLQVRRMIKQTVEHFGGLDVLINNAGAISLTSVAKTSPRRFDLMMQVNARAVYACSHYAIKALAKSEHGHILNLSPPINLNQKWLTPHSPYTLSKYGMTMLTLGMAGELAEQNIAVNSLWPQTTIATAAIEFAVGDSEMLGKCRTPAIMADAAYEVISSPTSFSGNCVIDEQILRERGVADFSQYQHDPQQTELYQDLFIDSGEGKPLA
jgi:citronellol/citronellal dehydrogenase